MSDPLNQEIVTALRALIRSEVKAAMAEFYIEVPNRSSPAQAKLQEALDIYENQAQGWIAKLEAIEAG